MLAHLTLVDVVGHDFRFRLVGTEVVRDFGRDPTGTIVGRNVAPAEYGAAIVASYERCRRDRMPLFTTGVYRAPSGLTHAVSRLLLPLSDDGEAVNMFVVSRVARIDRRMTGSYDWLGKAFGRLDVVESVEAEARLDTLVAEWERGIAPEADAVDDLVASVALGELD